MTVNLTPAFSTVTFEGNVLIKNDRSLEEVALIINSILNINLERDNTGYYEEFPAFSCNVLGIQFALLGNPEKNYRIFEAESRWFNLQISDTNKYNNDFEINLGTNIIYLLNSNSDLTCKEEWDNESYINRCKNTID